MGGRSKHLRKSMGYAQGKFAEEIGLSLTAYKNYEKGTREMPVSVLLKMIEFTKCDLVWLLTGKEHGSTEKVAERPSLKKEAIDKINLVFSTMNDAQVNQAVEIIQTLGRTGDKQKAPEARRNV